MFHDTEFFTALNEARELAEPLVLSPHGLPISFFVLVDHIGENGIYLKNPIPHNLLPFVTTAKAFSIHCRNYRLESNRLTPSGNFILFKTPDGAQQGVTRQMSRVSYYNSDEAFVKLVHPFDTGTVLQRPLYDLSNEGVSFRARLMTPFIQPGREIPSCQILFKNKTIGESAGRIVYVKQIFDLQGQYFYQVGMHLNQSIEVGA